MNKTQEEKLRERILQEAEKGNVVFWAIDGLATINLDEFIRQPAEGILYDLNRDKVTVMQFIDDPKWVNDFAVALVIEKLKEEIARLQARIATLKQIMEQ